MFNYTTTNLLNDLSRVSVVTQTEDKSIPTGGKGLKVKGVNSFIASCISPVWKSNGIPATKQVVDITIPAITAGLYRFSLVVKLNDSVDPDYARFSRDYGKTLPIEFNLAGSDTVTTLAAKLQKAFNKYNNSVSYKGTTFSVVGGKLRIEANTEYVRFQPDSALEKFDEVSDVFVNFSTVFTVVTQGNSGFGTAWNLLKNFRMPTQEATYFTAENLDERPIAGTLYNQYVFRYTVNRNISGTGAVGEDIVSTTTHVFYVLSNLSTGFETLLTTAGLTTVVVSTDPATPVDDEQGSDVVIP